MLLPHCPDQLPQDIDSELHRLASLWAKHAIRPRIERRVAAHWDDLISAWSADSSLPLLIRKSEQGVARGEVIRHESGRDLVPTDNSPASWSYYMAFSGETPSITDVRCALESDAIPIAMIVDSKMRARAHYKCCRVKVANPNSLGWKVCHKREIGLNGRLSLRVRPLKTLQEHFREFLSPSNLFLVPLLLSGLGEVPHFIEAISREPNGL